jgi:predicted phosphodiesterase
MKVAIVSDIHLGDGKCKLLEEDRTTKKHEVTQTYTALREAIMRFTGGSPLDYFVLNGDCLDFSINAFEESCKIARPFFIAIKNDNLAKEIIYIPGNHDKHVWDAVEWETNIIRTMKDHKDPRKFRRVQPGLVDYDKGYLELPGVTTVDGPGRYGTLFLEGLFEKDQVLPINIVYPNLYIKTAADTYLVTHGHMLELAWVLLSEFLAEVVGRKKVTIKELEEFNIPLTSMICTGVGQAGDVSKLFYKIQREAKNGSSRSLSRVMDHVIPQIDKMIGLGILEFLDNAVLKGVKRWTLKVAEKDVVDARYDKHFFERESVRMRFLTFYEASCVQAKGLGLSSPWKIIFGHTHDAIPSNKPMEITKKQLPQLKEEKVWLYNTGGWLKEKGKSAEVFYINENGILSSLNIQ